MARRGARAIHGEDATPSASEEWRAAVARADRGHGRWEPEEVWVDEGPADDDGGRRQPATASPRPPTRGSSGPAQSLGQANRLQGRRRNVPKPVVEEIAGSAGAQRGAKLAGRLADATHAYDRERYDEVRRMLRPIAEEVPDSASVQELYGLTLYRLGQWAPAVKHLEMSRALSGSFDQLPVMADCYRALRRYGRAEELWDELREASPSAALVAEGRIVAAGCRADQGDLQGAIAVLERASKKVQHPFGHHLRQWYALADLYERAGDIPRARDLFGRVAAVDPEAFDVRQRLRALR